MKKNLFCALFLSFLFLSTEGVLIAQDLSKGDEVSVNALSGLSLRAAPSLTADRLGRLDYGAKVTILDPRIAVELEAIDNLPGRWVEVETGGQNAFVFDAYLTTLPVPELQKPEYGLCFLDNLLSYIEDQLIFVDSMEYFNGFPGESYHLMKIYETQAGHQYVEHNYWEAAHYELQLDGVRMIEVEQLLRLLLQYCDQLSEEAKIEIAKLGDLSARPSIYLPLNEICCWIECRRYEDRLIIVVSEGI